MSLLEEINDKMTITYNREMKTRSMCSQFEVEITATQFFLFHHRNPQPWKGAQALLDRGRLTSVFEGLNEDSRHFTTGPPRHTQHRCKANPAYLMYAYTVLAVTCARYSSDLCIDSTDCLTNYTQQQFEVEWSNSEHYVKWFVTVWGSSALFCCDGLVGIPPSNHYFRLPLKSFYCSYLSKLMSVIWKLLMPDNF